MNVYYGMHVYTRVCYGVALEMGRGSSQSYAIDANTAHSHGMPHPTGANEARNNVDVLDVGEQKEM
jgi:hypothetical protein